MSQEPDKPTSDPRRMVPKWTVRHGRLTLAWQVSKPPEPHKHPARVPMPPAQAYREAAE